MRECRKFSFYQIGINEITGENEYYSATSSYMIWNKNNNCKYFKKRLFKKTSEKLYCKECRYWRRIWRG